MIDKCRWVLFLFSLIWTIHGQGAPSGVMFVDNTLNHPAGGKDLFSFPTVGGLVEYVQWKVINPSNGRYDFSTVTNLLIQGKHKGKKVALGVIAGVHVPDWYKTNYPGEVFRYSSIQRRSDLGFVNVPREAVLPWIRMETSPEFRINMTYFETFFAMLDALSNVIYENHLESNIAYLAVTGPGIANALETHLPITIYDEWRNSGWSPRTRELYIQSWVICTEAFRKRFPSLLFGLAVADNFGCLPGSTASNLQRINDQTIGREILNRVMVGENIGQQRLFPMGLWLAEWNSWGHPPHPLCSILKEYQDKGFKIGLQGHLMKHPDIAALRLTVERAVEAKASWIELWYRDIDLPGFEETLQQYARHFKP